MFNVIEIISEIISKINKDSVVYAACVQIVLVYGACVRVDREQDS